MATIQTNARFVEWLNVEEMHNGSKEWLSQLEFVKDEHLFFEELIRSYTLQLIQPEKFAHNKEIIDAINRSQKHNNLLIEGVKVHEKELYIMIDGIDQLKEEVAYKEKHRGLIIKISEFLTNYRTLKMQLFEIVKKIKKEEKVKLLLDKN